MPNLAQLWSQLMADPEAKRMLTNSAIGGGIGAAGGFLTGRGSRMSSALLGGLGGAGLGAGFSAFARPDNGSGAVKGLGAATPERQDLAGVKGPSSVAPESAVAAKGFGSWMGPNHGRAADSKGHGGAELPPDFGNVEERVGRQLPAIGAGATMAATQKPVTSRLPDLGRRGNFAAKLPLPLAAYGTARYLTGSPPPQQNPDVVQAKPGPGS